MKSDWLTVTTRRRRFLRDIAGLAAAVAVAGAAGQRLSAAGKGRKDGKRGACGGIHAPKGLEALNLSWYYTWRAHSPRQIVEGVEWVPQIFPHKSEPIKTACQRLKAEGCKVLLGFNEPDHPGQGNLSVKEAVEKWPLLMHTGAKLISPATTWASNGWMKEFMQQARQKKLDIDAVAIHWYGEPNANSFLNYAERAHKDYDKPIWITEFSVSDKEASRKKPTKISAKDVLKFARSVLPELERLDWVRRYCWYSPHKTTDAKAGASCLLDDDGQLTELGRYFAGL